MLSVFQRSSWGCFVDHLTSDFLLAAVYNVFTHHTTSSSNNLPLGAFSIASSQQCSKGYLWRLSTSSTAKILLQSNFLLLLSCPRDPQFGRLWPFSFKNEVLFLKELHGERSVSFSSRGFSVLNSKHNSFWQFTSVNLLKVNQFYLHLLLPLFCWHTTKESNTHTAQKSINRMFSTSWAPLPSHVGGFFATCVVIPWFRLKLHVWGLY